MAVDQLSRVFTALGDPTRRAILQRLMSGDADVAELAKPFAMSQPAISHHLALLSHGRLVERRRSGNHIFYGLTEAGRGVLGVSGSLMG